MTEETKLVVDLAAGTITITALMKIVPAATAILSLVWICIRIWETETVKKLTNRE